MIAQSNFFAFFFSEPKIDDEQKASANNDDKLAPLATKTWDGGGATNNWSEAANWSGDVVPVAADVAVFDNTSSKNAVIDVDVTVTSVSIFDLYLGTISQVSFVKSDHRQKNRKIIF